MKLKNEAVTYGSQERFSHESSSCVQEELHFRYLLVDLLHKLYYEVDKFVLQHFFRVSVGDEERDVVSLDLVSNGNQLAGYNRIPLLVCAGE